jgi:hypothetical protein
MQFCKAHPFSRRGAEIQPQRSNKAPKLTSQGINPQNGVFEPFHGA